MSSYKSRMDFIRDNKKGIKKIGLIEYCKELENQGLDKNQIQQRMINDNATTSVSTCEVDFRYYSRVKPLIGWM